MSNRDTKIVLKENRVNVRSVEPRNLPKPAKVAIVHALRDLGISVRNIAENLGIAKTSVENYLKENPDVTWDDFGTAIKDAVMVKEEEVASLTLDAMLTVVPEASLGELTRLYETLRRIRFSVSTTVPGTHIPIPPGGVHFHRHTEITKIVKKAEDEAEEMLRKEIKEGKPILTL